MSTRIRRIQRDIKTLQNNPPEGISISVDDDDIGNIKAIIIGPEGTPFANGIFRLTINFPMGYPDKPPNVKFVTPIFHPNISNGNICISMLKTGGRDGWSPAYTLEKVLLSLASFLTDPNPDDPLNDEAADMYLDDYDTYAEKVRKMTANSAI